MRQGDPKKILVADDEPDVLKVIGFRLSSKGYEVILATNGQEALEKINEQKPDLILLDYRMPYLNGFEVCQHVRENKSLKNIPIIIITAGLSTLTNEDIALVCADAWISKPFDIEELFQTIEKLLTKSTRSGIQK